MGAKPKTNEDSYAMFERLKADKQGFRQLRSLLKDWTGISLDNDEAGHLKMANRLSRILVRHNVSNFKEYARLLSHHDPELLGEFVSALTTNTTRFFRENAQIEKLESLLPEVIQRNLENGKKELRVWCAACSTGQESYTLAMTCLQVLNKFPDIELKILATDIDHRALEKAANGIYEPSETTDISKEKLETYFLVDTNSGRYHVNQKVKKCIRFAPFNLHTSKYPFQYPFDIIFCRNVLFYFSREAALEIIRKTVGKLEPKGLLFVGYTEVGYVRSPELSIKEYGIYQKTHRKEKK